jgi:hypothetical protein
MRLGLLLRVQEDFQQALEKELKRPVPFVFRHAVPFFSALSADAELGGKATVFPVRI